jgi:hypothetical protein
MKRTATFISHTVLLIVLVLSLSAGRAEAIKVTFMGRLASFDGIMPSLWSKIAVDKERAEVFTLNPRQRDVRIFNETGMEIFGFGDNIELAGASDIELGEDGNIYLVYPRGEEHKLLRLDYKGEPLASIDLKDVPEEFLPFSPSRLQYLDGRLYLADTGTMNIIVTDIEGHFQEGYNGREALMALEDAFAGHAGEEVFKDPKRFEYLDMSGFCVDQDGNMYFTVSVLFSAFKLSPDGGLQMFGRAGSAPGKFGVVAGITTDGRGNIYVTDRLRSVVLIFDAQFNFLTEFGYRGLGPGNLIVPDDVIVDDVNGRIYVAQAAGRGVSVYRLTTEDRPLRQQEETEGKGKYE